MRFALGAAGRGRWKNAAEICEGPIAPADAVGSPAAALVDLSSVAVAGTSAAVACHIDGLTAYAERCCELAAAW